MLETGVIATDAGDVIARPGMSLEEFASTRIGSSAKTTPTGPGWQKVEIGPFLLNGVEMLAAAYFFEGCIGSLELNLSQNEVNRRFSAQLEQGPGGPETFFYKKFVEDDTKGLSTATYQWGNLAAFFDVKSYSSGIVLTYAGVGVTKRPHW